MDKRRINIDIPEELWKQVTIYAAVQGINKRELVIEALKNYLVTKRSMIIKEE